ncbi:hypothetical protein TNCV_4498061 [Trichonephila clavipes]|nr:hypothetical protein TNCV_4498061 [Trichonephila clavipes]
MTTRLQRPFHFLGNKSEKSDRRIPDDFVFILCLKECAISASRANGPRGRRLDNRYRSERAHPESFGDRNASAPQGPPHPESVTRKSRRQALPLIVVLFYVRIGYKDKVTILLRS